MAPSDSNDAVHSQPEVDSVSAMRDRLLASGLLRHEDFSNAEDFAIAISPFGPLLRHSVPPTQSVFRGVERAEYDLVPSALRPHCPYRELCPRIHFSDSEGTARDRFEHIRLCFLYALGEFYFLSLIQKGHRRHFT